MRTRWKEELFEDFTLVESPNGSFIVSHNLPDKSKEIIGHIYSRFNEEEGTVSYISLNNEGEEIIPSTTVYTEVEIGFEKYTRQQSKRIQEQEWEEKANSIAERTNEIKKVRKSQNIKTLQLNK